MKKGRKIVTRLLSWLLVMTLLCTGVPISVNAAKRPKLNKTSVKLKVGKTVKLKVKNNKKKVKWSSANKKIATVNKKGLVKAKKKGKTRIIAKIKKKKYICKVTVQAKETDNSDDYSEEGNSSDPNGYNDGGSGNTVQVTQTPSDGTAKPGETPGKTPPVQKTSAPGASSEPHPGPQITPEPGTSSAPGENTPIPWGTPEPGATTVPGENTPIPWGTPEPGATTVPGENTPIPWGTPEPGTTTVPGENTPIPWGTPGPGTTIAPWNTQTPWGTPEPGTTTAPWNTQTPWVTPEPGTTTTPWNTQTPWVTPEPGTTTAPWTTPTPQVSQNPQKTTSPGITTGPNPTTAPTKAPTAAPTKAPTTAPTKAPTAAPTKAPTTAPTTAPTATPSQGGDIPSGATVFTMGSKKLAIGMSKSAVESVLGSGTRSGMSPQGFKTLAYNKSDYSEYLLIYLQNDKVVGICGIGKSMSFDTAVAGQNGSNLSGWTDLSGYKVGSKAAARKKTVKTNEEQAYEFFDASGDNTIYCIQVFDPSKVKDAANDMIYKTSNLSYDSTVTSSIATEIGHMLNAFRAYKGKNKFNSYEGLTKCAQDYCNVATSKELVGRPDSEACDENGDPLPGTLLRALFDHNVDPDNWGEVCYTDAADAISFANSLIELDDFYKVLVNTKIVDGETPIWKYAGVGMAYNGSHAYVTVDYVDNP